MNFLERGQNSRNRAQTPRNGARKSRNRAGIPRPRAGSRTTAVDSVAVSRSPARRLATPAAAPRRDRPASPAAPEDRPRAPPGTPLDKRIYMDTIHTVYTLRLTQAFQDWLDGLNDSGHRFASPPVCASRRLVVSETGSLLAAKCLKCEWTSDPVTACISHAEEACLSSCLRAETSPRRSVTSSARNASSENWSWNHE